MKIKTLGDPHLGRRFRTGVPLHRLGEREELVWKEFEASLRGDMDLHVNMGDLFDKFIVPINVVLRAADAYIDAARHQAGCRFVVLRGNHDVSRDSTQASSFDLFTRLVEGLPNIQVVHDQWVWEGLGFVGYQPFRPTAEVVAELPDGLSAVYGHFDVVDFGGDNVIPTKLLAEKGISQAYSGHDHLARELDRDGVHVTVTGSMQPYSHAEDPEGKLYITTPLPIERDVTNLNVRVLLQEGESLPADLDCLSLTAKRIEAEDVTVDTSDFETFDIPSMLAGVLEGLSIKDELLERFHADGV